MVHLLEDSALRNCDAVFRDRNDAGRRLAAFMRQHRPVTDPLICAIPAGGVPIGLELAKGIPARMFLGVVRKLKIPWNPEAGFGAMTWNGKVYLNQELVRILNLTGEEIRQAAEETEKNIRERIDHFTGGLPIPPIQGRTVIITDDGLASGYTMMAAVNALNSENPDEIIVAVPTGSAKAVAMISSMVATTVCLNLRDSYPFAVADAYQNWNDLDDEEVIRSLSLARRDQLLY